MENNNENQQKSALVAIIGRPSCGKSTFLNTVCAAPVSIVSQSPQTTRNCVRGIVTRKGKGQLVFLDTPGLHESQKKLNLKLYDISTKSLKDAEIVLYIIDATRACRQEEKQIASLLQGYATKTVIAINKIDSPEAKAENALEFIKENFSLVPQNRIINISAKSAINTKKVLDVLFEIAPQGELLYPKECYTDQEVNFRIAEVIRQNAINNLEQELPHALYIDIADMEFKKNGKLLWVRAFLCVERESQKGIVIGQKASMIKKIRLQSLKQLATIFDYDIELDLQVKVDKNWRQKDAVLNHILK